MAHAGSETKSTPKGGKRKQAGGGDAEKETPTKKPRAKAPVKNATTENEVANGDHQDDEAAAAVSQIKQEESIFGGPYNGEF